MRRRRHRYKPKRRLKNIVFKNKVVLGSLFFIINSFILFYFLFFTPLFKIKEVNIKGERSIPLEEIKNVISSNFDMGAIIFFNSKKIEKEILKRFPEINSVKIQRNFPNILNIEIEEKEPVAVFCQKEDCQFLDENGFLFKRNKEIPNDLPIIKMETQKEFSFGENVIPKDDLLKILEIKDGLEKLNIKTKEFILKNNQLISKTLLGADLYFTLKENPSVQILKLEAILKDTISIEELSKIKYIDLRFSRVYILR
jgi:hypothetical protein